MLLALKLEYLITFCLRKNNNIKVYVCMTSPRMMVTDLKYAIEVKFLKQWTENYKNIMQVFRLSTLDQKAILLTKWKFKLYK